MFERANEAARVAEATRAAEAERADMALFSLSVFLGALGAFGGNSRSSTALGRSAASGRRSLASENTAVVPSAGAFTTAAGAAAAASSSNVGAWVCGFVVDPSPGVKQLWTERTVSGVT